MKRRSIYHRDLPNICQRLCTAIQNNDLESIWNDLLHAEGQQDSILLAFATAVQNGNPDVVRIFLETGHVNIDDPDLMFGETALMHAVRNGHLSVIKFLLENGADVNAISSQNGDTALHICVSGPEKPQNNVEVLEYLLKDNKINLDAPNADGDTPLMKASSQTKIQEVKRLLDAKCKINSVNPRNGQSPVHFCLKAGYFHSNALKIAECFQLFLDNGINPDFENEQGVPLIGFVLKTGNYRVLTLLLYVNCDINILYKEVPDLCMDFPPLVYACQRKEIRFVRTLLAAGCNFYNYLEIVRNTLLDTCIQWLDYCSLKELCRTAIRKRLGHYPHKVIDKLGMPKPIQDYILLKNVLGDIEMK